MKIKILFDKSTYVITLFCICLVFGLPVLFYFAFDNLLSTIITLIVGVIPLIIAASFAPRYYLVQKDEIIIKQVVGKIIINKGDVENITIIDSAKVKSLVRTFASGGFFGYYGSFYSNSLKHVKMYAGNSSKNLILIKTNTKKSYIITPKEMKIFTNAMSEYFANSNP